MTSLTVAVIGHVDHGKTALVRALTGMETDRLKEEIERGLSITLGFTWRGYPSGAVDFIDTPGHEDFIRAMVAGATGARAVLLVVSATEGFGRQTWEHLRIAALLGIEAGIVAVAKADLISPARQAAVRADVAAALADTVLADAPVVLCSAVSGRGLDDLHERLEDLCRRRPAAERLAGGFLPIDRAFTMAGSGTIVTGTLHGGALRSGGEAILQPSGRKVVLRRIQVHGVDVDEAGPGGRVAVGLRGVPVDDVRAGDVLCEPDAFASALQVDVVIVVPPESARAVEHMDELRVMWGARRDVATARLIGARSIPPGRSGLAQLRFSAPVIAFAGQRAVLRRPSPAETVGGALVLDPAAAPLRGRTAARVAVLEAVMSGDVDRIAVSLAGRRPGMVSVDDVSRLARRPGPDVRAALVRSFEDLDAGRLVLRDAVAEMRAAYVDELAQAHRRAPARAAAPAGVIRAALARLASPDLVGHVERALAAEGAIRLDGNLVALAGHDPLAALSAEALARLRQIEASLRDGATAPPDAGLLSGPDGEDRDLLQLLVESGRAVSLRNVALRQTLVFHRDALAAALETLRSVFPRGSFFTTGEARATLDTSRKFIVPLLEHFDAIGVTHRDGDLRQVAFPEPAPADAAPKDA